MLGIDVHLKNGEVVQLADNLIDDEDEIVVLADGMKSVFDNRMYGRPRNQRGITIVNADEVTHFTIREI